MPTRLLPLVLLLASLNSACGVMMQYAYGFDEEVSRVATRTKRVRLDNVPEGASVERRGPGGVTALGEARTDEVEYEVDEVIAVPRSRVPLFIGAVVDVLACGAFTYYAATTSDSGRAQLAAYTAGYFGAGVLGDLAFLGLYPSDGPDRVLRYAPAEAAPVTYVAYSDAGIFEQRVNVGWTDKVVFSSEPIGSGPGGPRVEAPPSAPIAPPPQVEIETSPEVEEFWYGWQLLPIDAGAATMIVLGQRNGETPLVLGGIALAAFAPPLVHLANGELERAGGSLGLRVGAPIVSGAVLGGAFGLLMLPFGTDWARAGAIVGAIGGASAAGIVVPFADDLFLAWKEVDPEPLAASASGLSIVPTAGVTPDGRPTFGLAGRF